MTALPTPLAASDAIADLLTGSARPAEIIHRSGPATYLRLDDGRIVAAETAGGIDLPIAMTLRRRPAGAVGTTVMLGGDPPRRWWSSAAPLIVPVPERVRLLEVRLAALPPPTGPLERPLLGLDPLTDAAALVGLGPGLTPAGDDLVAGTIVGLRSIGDAATASTLVGQLDLDRTTPISAALLVAAARGRAARPLLHLVRSLAGVASTDDALDGLLAVGATSGRWLASGVLRAVRQL